MHWQAIMHWYKQSTAQLRIHVRRMQIKGFPILWRAHLQSSHIKGHLDLYFASLFWTIGNNAWLWRQKTQFPPSPTGNVCQANPLRADFSGKFQSKTAIIELSQAIDLEGKEEFPREPAVLKRVRFRAPLILTLDSKHLKRIFSWLAGA